MEYKNHIDPELRDYFAGVDLGVPLAFCVSEGIVESTDTVQAYIEEAWVVLLQVLEIKDNGFTSNYQEFKIAAGLI